MVVATIEGALEAILTVLQSEPAGLFADFDGTLSHIAPVPDAAHMHPDIVPVLPVLKEQLPLLAVITGRATEDVIEKVGIPDLLYVGNHGLEWSENGTYRAHPVGEAAALEVEAALAEIDDDLKGTGLDLTGLLYENKRLSASIHFRVVADPDEMERVLTPITAARAVQHGLQMTTGKMMVELRPTSSVSKGSALEEIVLARKLRGVIFLGDDVTDVDAFRTVRRLRDEGVIAAGLSIGILSEDTKPIVIEQSDLLVGDVNAVAELLSALSAHLSKA